MRTPPRVAVAGASGIGKHHAKWFAAAGAVMAREQADILDVCTPNALHFDCARTGLRNGCHVLCEKPLVWGGERFEQDAGAG